MPSSSETSRSSMALNRQQTTDSKSLHRRGSGGNSGQLRAAFSEIGQRIQIGTKDLGSRLSDAIVSSLKTCDGQNTTKNVDSRNEISFLPPVDDSVGDSVDAFNGTLRPVALLATGLGSTTQNAVATEAWGTYSFNFRLDVVNRDTLRAVATSKNMSVELPLHCRWKRKLGNLLIDIPGTDGLTSYSLTADDVGSTLMVEATAMKSGEDGAAYASLGPFELDASSRRNLDDYLTAGGTRFPVMLVENSSDTPGTETHLMLHVESEKVFLVKPGPNNVGFTRKWEANIGPDFPQVILATRQPLQFTLHLSADEQVTLAAMARQQRDLIALTIRCFKAQRYVTISALLQIVARQHHSQLSGNDHSPPMSFTTNEGLEGLLDLFVISERLSSELAQSLERVEKANDQRERAITEKEAFQADAEVTISAYKDLLAQQEKSGAQTGEMENTENTQKSAADVPGMSPKSASDLSRRAAYIAELEGKVKNAEKMTKKYVDELELLRRDFRRLKDKYEKTQAESKSAAGPSTGSRMGEMTLESTTMTDHHSFEDLQWQIENLQKLNQQLKHKGQQQEESIRQLQGQLLRLREDSVTETEKHSANTKEARHLRNEVEELTVEIRSLQQRLRIAERERKETQENFMYVKARLDETLAMKHDEALGNEKSKQQTEKKVVDAVARAHDLQEKIHAIEEAHRQEVDKLQKEMKSRHAEIADLQTENNSLRSRIRKLAMVS